MSPKLEKLFFSNMGNVPLGEYTPKWHSIEMVDLVGGDKKNMRVVVEDVDRPRGLHVDEDGKWVLVNLH